MDGEFYESYRNSSKSYADRYKNCKLLRDISSGESILASRDIVDIPTSSSDQYHRVKSNESFRLDIIAANYYKNPLMWWVIAQANGIHNPFIKIPAGTILRIPSIETLYGNGGILL